MVDIPHTIEIDDVQVGAQSKLLRVSLPSMGSLAEIGARECQRANWFRSTPLKPDSRRIEAIVGDSVAIALHHPRVRRKMEKVILYVRPY